MIHILPVYCKINALIETGILPEPALYKIFIAWSLWSVGILHSLSHEIFLARIFAAIAHTTLGHAFQVARVLDAMVMHVLHYVKEVLGIP